MSKREDMRFSLLVKHDDPIVRDHRLFQERIMPGVTFVDIILRFLFSKGFEIKQVELRNLIFKQAIVTSEDFDRRLRVQFQRMGDHWTIHAMSQRVKGERIVDPEWVDNMQGELHLHDDWKGRRIDIGRLIVGAAKVHDLDRAYSVMRAIGIEHFEFMKLHGCVHEIGNDFLAELRLGDLAKEYLQYFCMHPAMLDGATCLMGMVMEQGGETYMPIGLESFRASRQLDARCYALLKDQRGAFEKGADVGYIDIELYDVQGELIATFRRFSSLRVRSKELIKSLAALPASRAESANVSLPHEPSALWDAHSLPHNAIELIEVAVGRKLNRADYDTGFYDLGLDSQRLLALVRQLEAKLGTTLYPTLLFEHNTVNKLLRFIGGFKNATPAQPKVASGIAEAPQAGESVGIDRMVIELVSGVIGRPILGHERKTGFYDLGMDSQNLIQLVRELEKRLGKTLYPTLLFEYSTIDRLIDYLSENVVDAALLPQVNAASPLQYAPDVARGMQDKETGKLCYRPKWLEQPSQARRDVPHAGNVWVILDSGGEQLASALSRQHSASEIGLVQLGDKEARLSVNRWQCDVKRPDSLRRVVEQLPAPDAIYFLGGLSASGADALDPDACLRGQEFGVVSLFRLVQALQARGFGGKRLCLKVVTARTQKVVDSDAVRPHTAALHGMVRTIANEYPTWACSVIDLDDPVTEPNGGNAKQSHADVIVQTEQSAVAVRYGKCFTLEFDSVNARMPGHGRFRRQGVYLLIGGGGGIGMALAGYLARHYHAKLVLVGRSEVDDARRSELRQLERDGGQAMYIQADAASEDDMRRVIMTTQARFGVVHGIIHMALVLRDCMLAAMDESVLRAVLRPKADGSLAVARAALNLPLDFLLFFSSAQSFYGSVGQGNYAAASTYQDALAHAVQAQAAYPVHVVNWGYWGEVGVVANNSYRSLLAQQGIYSIDVEEGFAALEDILKLGSGQLAAIKASPEALRRMMGTQATAAMIPGIDDGMSSSGMHMSEIADEVRHGCEAFRQLERYGAQLLLSALRGMGVFQFADESWSKKALHARLGVVPQYRRLCDEAVNLLCEAGLLCGEGAEFRLPIGTREAHEWNCEQLARERNRLERDYPEIAPHLRLLHMCVQSYPEVLTGRKDYVAVMFPRGSTAYVEAVYRGNAVADHFNQTVADAIEQEVMRRLRSRPESTVTLLEVGAGTGGTSRHVLRKLLPYARQLRYFYTDVAMMLTPENDPEFRATYPFVEFRRLDLEKDPVEQGFAPSGIDIAMGSNVLHTTSNIARTVASLKSLLRPDAYLVINEITKKTVFTTATFGMTSGWWSSADDGTREPGSPLLSETSWKNVLEACGFAQIGMQQLPSEMDVWGQRVIVARNSGASAAVANDPSSVRTFDSPETVRTHADGIAIIGIAGRYPGAANLAEFWEILRNGRDCITEIPRERWQLEGFFDPEHATGERSYSKWGSFLSDVDKFDPLFFNIAPSDAELMDPQERLFLETVWHLLEDAAVTRTSLADTKVGVFVGAMWSHYQMLALERARAGKAGTPTSIHASIANRVSYFFDFQGPSIALDTMCSSSLSAIHHACESIARGECEVAVAGGVNVSVHPHKYWFLSAARMASTDGRCRSFGDGGDGFAPGEGVGAVLLKPLSKAISDGNRIYAVVKGSAIGHNGRTAGYAVPDPQAQARTIAAALRAADIDPDTISYVEAQGTGSPLGDPIEIAGLAQAFDMAGRSHTRKTPCAIGSVKSNIGHLESAAGIAAVTKVVLQMRHRELVPSLHAATLNPQIDFASSPFVVQRELRDWAADADGSRDIRRASVSAFGAGGSNAHVVLEDFVDTRANGEARGPYLIVLSARDRERLQALAALLLDDLQHDPHRGLDAIAYTLQSGREEMEERWAVVVSSMAQLRDRLAALTLGRTGVVGVHEGNVRIGKSHLPSDAMLAQAMGAEADLDELAARWVCGAAIDWGRLYGVRKPIPVSLPGYPFARIRCWIDDSESRAPADVSRMAGKISPVAQATYPAAPRSGDALHQTVRAKIVEAVAEITKAHLSQIDPDRSFAEFGVNSISGLSLIKRINAEFGIKMATTILFEHVTANALTHHIIAKHPDALTRNASVPFKPDDLDSAKGALRSGAGKINQATSASGRYRAILLQGPGEIEDIGIMQVEPTEPADDEVQVLVKAFSLNFGDLLCVQGMYPTMPDYPFTPGIEFSGVVLKCGANVDRLHAGDEVIGLMGFGLGAHSEVVTVPQHAVVEKPSNVSHEQACAFPVVYLTIYQVFERLRLQRGEKILIQTAAGGTGLIAVQMALALGAEVFVTAGSEAKLEYLRKLGVHHCINYRTQDFASQVLEITDGYGVDAVINTLSGDAIQKSLDILAPWGRYAEIAMTALKTSGPLDFSRFTRNQTFFSIDFRRFMLEHDEQLPRYLKAMAEVLEKGEVTPTVSKVFSFGQIHDAFHYLRNRDNIGKVVVTTEVDLPVAVEVPISAAQASGAQMDIAIVGMAGRFPGARNLEAFWQNLADGKSSIAECPPERWDTDAWYDRDPARLDKTYCRWGGFLDGIDQFDPVFFNMSGKEARMTDPAQRLFLEECWNAIEDAGYDARAMSSMRCGVFVGALSSEYSARMAAAGVQEEAQALWGNATSVLAARISYFLNLKGPAVAIDTACSSSLVALHMACQSIRAGDCDIALAGGVYVNSTPHTGLSHQNSLTINDLRSGL